MGFTTTDHISRLNIIMLQYDIAAHDMHSLQSYVINLCLNVICSFKKLNYSLIWGKSLMSPWHINKCKWFFSLLTQFLYFFCTWHTMATAHNTEMQIKSFELHQFAIFHETEDTKLVCMCMNHNSRKIIATPSQKCPEAVTQT